MFDSGKSVKDVIDMIKSSLDIEGSISDDLFLFWVNEVEQLLYSEMIREYGIIEVEDAEFPYNLPSEIRFEDIYRLYIDDIEYEKATPNSIFECTFYKIWDTENKCDVVYVVPATDFPSKLKIIYIKRPPIKTEVNEKVMLPIEWLKIIISYCKSMAYKEYNDFIMANNWIAEYNAYVQDFQVWIASKQPEFGR